MVLYQAGKLNLSHVIYDNIYSDTIKTIFLKIIDLNCIHNQSSLYFFGTMHIASLYLLYYYKQTIWRQHTHEILLFAGSHRSVNGRIHHEAWLSLKTKKAMKGGGACSIHRAMKYRSVDIRWRGRQDVCNTRSHSYSEFSPNRQAISIDCWDLVWGVVV